MIRLRWSVNVSRSRSPICSHVSSEQRLGRDDQRVDRHHVALHRAQRARVALGGPHHHRRPAPGRARCSARPAVIERTRVCSKIRPPRRSTARPVRAPAARGGSRRSRGCRCRRAPGSPPAASVASRSSSSRRSSSPRPQARASATSWRARAHWDRLRASDEHAALVGPRVDALLGSHARAPRRRWRASPGAAPGRGPARSRGARPASTATPGTARSTSRRCDPTRRSPAVSASSTTTRSVGSSRSR